MRKVRLESSEQKKSHWDTRPKQSRVKLQTPPPSGVLPPIRMDLKRGRRDVKNLIEPLRQEAGNRDFLRKLQGLSL